MYRLMSFSGASACRNRSCAITRLAISSLIGVLMLMGIAAKNSILLVDYIIIAEANGMSRWDAIMDAAHKRARPIIMTTFAMGAGMLPVALGWGADVEFRSPMAKVVMMIGRARLWAESMMAS